MTMRDEDYEIPPCKAPIMHSHDRTYIASLGFGDPDKQNPTHDLACQYLGTPEVARKLRGLLASDWAAIVDDDEARKSRNCFVAAPLLGFKQSYRTGVGPAIFEHPIGTGTGQYRRIIAFLDVVIPVMVEVDTLRIGRDRNSNVISVPDVVRRKAYIAIEVKIHPGPIGDLIRQLKLYREHFTGIHEPSSDRFHQPKPEQVFWAVAATSDPSAIDLASLKQSDITFLRLGDDFQSWVDEQRAFPAETADVMTI